MVDLRRMEKDPHPNIEARPLQDNILEWRFIVLGPQGSPYEGGTFMGRLKFPESYPLQPPGECASLSRLRSCQESRTQSACGVACL